MTKMSSRLALVREAASTMRKLRMMRKVVEISYLILGPVDTCMLSELHHDLSCVLLSEMLAALLSQFQACGIP